MSGYVTPAVELEPEVVGTLSAAAETILPGSSADEVHVRVGGMFEAAMQGFAFLVHSLLDSYAAGVQPGATFVSLGPEQRSTVLETMLADESVDVRDVVDGLFLFTLGQTYDETNPRREEIWARMGYHGPSEGEPGYA